MNIKKKTVEFLGGYIFSIVGAVCFYVISIIHPVRQIVEDYLGGDKGQGFLIIFLGVPIGTLVGIVLVNKIIFKCAGFKISRLAIGFIISEASIVLGFLVIFVVGCSNFYLAMFVLVSFANLHLLIKRELPTCKGGDESRPSVFR